MSDQNSRKFSKRDLLRFAGRGLLTGSVAQTFLQIFRPNQAQAQTWNKVYSGTGAAGTWQKIQLGPRNSSRIHAIASSLALRADGTVYGTGNNFKGQIGDGTTTDRSSFVQALGISNATAIASGVYGNSYALRADGFVFTTGRNGSGELGDNTGTSASRSTFAQALGVSNAVAIAAGTIHCLALRSDGFVFGVGRNVAAELGDGTSGNFRSTFVQALGISNAVAIAAFGMASIALRSDGLVFACGYNNKGQVGDNSTANKSSWIQTIGISNAVGIGAGKYHTLAVRADGLVFACGYNLYGQLGDGTVTNKSTYVQALGVSNVVAVACGYFHSIALTSDGLVFTTGGNTAGQLGDNTTTNRSTFAQALGISNATRHREWSHLILCTSVRWSHLCVWIQRRGGTRRWNTHE